MTTMMMMTMITMVRMIGCEDVMEREEMLRLAFREGAWVMTSCFFVLASDRVS